MPRRWRLAKIEAGDRADPFSMAVIRGVLGDRDKAFEWLERTWQNGHCWLIKVYPFQDPLRNDPRYAEYLRRAVWTSEALTSWAGRRDGPRAVTP
jgi:hypothetical protein